MAWFRRSRPDRWFRWFLCSVPVFALAGCVQHTASDGVDTFGYEPWVPLAAAVAGIVAAPVGWVVRQHSARFGWGLLVLSPIGVFLFAPSLWRDRVTVDDRGFHSRTGIWGLTAVHDVQFDDLRTLKIVSEKSRGRSGSRINYYFMCERKSGEVVKVPVNNEVSRAGAALILQRVGDHGIPIVDTTE